jgi:hypothetical protein
MSLNLLSDARPIALYLLGCVFQRFFEGRHFNDLWNALYKFDRSRCYTDIVQIVDYVNRAFGK